MNSKTNITAIILAGGRSSRMGTDKGFAMYNNQPFVVHIIKAIQDVVSDIIIVSNNTDYDKLNLKRVDDIISNAGPLAGVYTGLYHSKTENNLVLSCDLPLLKKELVTLLINEISTAYDIVQVSVQGNPNPLLAMYKKHCVSPFLAALKSEERRLQTVVNQQKTKTIKLKPSLEKYAQNINTSHQLNQLYNAIED